jgi:hypothetical protein
MRNLFSNRHFGSGSCRREILGRSSVLRFLDLASSESQTEFMAHIYLSFDFAKDEEKAQQARHKLEGWKQAFRLDKKLLYKVERVAAVPNDGEATSKAEKSKPKGKGKAAAATAAVAAPSSNDDIKLLVRLAFSGHEKLSEQRWVQRIPSEEPFQGASPAVVKPGDASFESTEKQFEELA